MVSVGLLSIALLGVADLFGVAQAAMDGKRAGFDEPTGAGPLDFLIEIAPGINLLLFALLGHRMRQVKQTAAEVATGVRRIQRSGVRVITDSRGVARAVTVEDPARGYDAEGREWVLVSPEPGGRRAYDGEGDKE